uniref:Uncharacterized protein n=1 Tax=Megaselia scalaris TaxID=36166 RepID=T1GCN9_MEGSC
MPAQEIFFTNPVQDRRPGGGQSEHTKLKKILRIRLLSGTSNFIQDPITSIYVPTVMLQENGTSAVTLLLFVTVKRKLVTESLVATN